ASPPRKRLTAVDYLQAVAEGLHQPGVGGRVSGRSAPFDCPHDGGPPVIPPRPSSIHVLLIGRHSLMSSRIRPLPASQAPRGFVAIGEVPRRGVISPKGHPPGMRALELPAVAPR